MHESIISQQSFSKLQFILQLPHVEARELLWYSKTNYILYVIYIGVLLLVTAALMFFSAGGLKNFVMEDAESTGSVYRNYAKIYNRDNELQAEKM